MKQISYKELLSVIVSENEQIVISECSEGGYTIGKKVFAEVNGKKIGVFLKGAIKINDLEGLEKFKNALNTINFEKN